MVQPETIPPEFQCGIGRNEMGTAVGKAEVVFRIEDVHLIIPECSLFGAVFSFEVFVKCCYGCLGVWNEPEESYAEGEKAEDEPSDETKV